MGVSSLRFVRTAGNEVSLRRRGPLDVRSSCTPRRDRRDRVVRWGLQSGLVYISRSCERACVVEQSSLDLRFYAGSAGRFRSRFGTSHGDPRPLASACGPPHTWPPERRVSRVSTVRRTARTLSAARRERHERLEGSLQRVRRSVRDARIGDTRRRRGRQALGSVWSEDDADPNSRARSSRESTYSAIAAGLSRYSSARRGKSIAGIGEETIGATGHAVVRLLAHNERLLSNNLYDLWSTSRRSGDGARWTEHTPPFAGVPLFGVEIYRFKKTGSPATGSPVGRERYPVSPVDCAHRNVAHGRLLVRGAAKSAVDAGLHLVCSSSRRTPI